LSCDGQLLIDVSVCEIVKCAHCSKLINKESFS
jgi:hypothetical protein